MNNREYMRERRAKLVQKRICPACGTRKPKRGYVACQECIDARKVRARQSKLTRDSVNKRAPLW